MTIAADEAELQKAEFQQENMQLTEEFFLEVFGDGKSCSYGVQQECLFLIC